jgi:heat shock protein HslJ
MSIKKVIIFPFILSVLAIISGCNSSSTPGNEISATPSNTSSSTTTTDLTSLQSAKTKWDSNSAQYYTIQSQRLCECLPQMTAQMEVSVLNNSVLSAVEVNSSEVIPQETQEEIQTVDSIFALIEKAIEDDISIEVIYNEKYGYPEMTKIDVEQLAVDGGLHIILSNLDLQDSQSALDDVTWTLESFDNIAGPQPVIENSNITLSFDMENGQLQGIGGCNNYSANFVLDSENHDITISNVTRTEMACSEPESIMQQEQNYFATLSQIRFFTFDKTTLNMVVGGDAGLHFIVTKSATGQPKIDDSSDDFASLQSARKKWNSNSGQYYTVQSQRICFCLPEMSAVMNISVLDNSVLSAIDTNSGEIISKEIQEEIQTVESLFTLIEKAITDGISIEVTYNEAFGYPEMTKIDVEQIAADGGLQIELSNLEFQGSQLALDDVNWTLESFDSIAGPQVVIENTNITLSIDMENRQLKGVGGCNDYSADFVLDEKNYNMTISNVISTEMACSEPENIMQQEHNYFATLEQIRFFTFDKATLNMVVGGDAGLHFVAD